jgi:glycosyltransferase involved in cell wall biosynthesis
MARLLLLTTGFDMGGAERVVAELSHGLTRRGHQVFVVCLQRRSGALLHHLDLSKVRVVDLGMRSKVDVRAVWRLYRLLRAERIEVLYSFLFHAHVAGRLAARMARLPVVLAAQQTMGLEGRLRNLLTTGTTRWCTKVIAVSRNVEQFVVNTMRIPRSKVTTIYNCVDVAKFPAPTASPLRTPGRPTLGIVARLSIEKDHLALLQALKLVREAHPDARLLIAGEGPEEARLREFVSQSGLTGGVEFLGRVEDVPAVLSAVDVYVQSSRTEGLPCAVLEALAAEVPVVATRVGGTDEVVEHRRTGLLVEPGDSRAMAEAACWLLERPDEARAMARRGRALVSERMSAEAMVRDTDALIGTLLDEQARMMTAAGR